MICAHSIRRLKPGTFDGFPAHFGPPDGADPGGWVRFHALRSLADEDVVMTFGFFDGTLAEMERSRDDLGSVDQKASLAPLVDEVLANGVYEIVVSKMVDNAAA
jgi:hypothetical protein